MRTTRWCWGNVAPLAILPADGEAAVRSAQGLYSDQCRRVVNYVVTVHWSVPAKSHETGVVVGSDADLEGAGKAGLLQM